MTLSCYNEETVVSKATMDCERRADTIVVEWKIVADIGSATASCYSSQKTDKPPQTDQGGTEQQGDNVTGGDTESESTK
jgi:hypothetical protein